MSNKLRSLEDKLKLFKISGKALHSTCGTEDILQTFYVVSNSEKTAISTLNDREWGSDEIYIDEIVELGNKDGYRHDFIFSDKALNLIKIESDKLYSIKKQIKKEFLEDYQFLRYFRSLFSDLYDEMKGIEIYIEDVADLNNGKPFLYERVPESRLEFLMYLKSTIDFMIQEEKTETEENNISLN